MHGSEHKSKKSLLCALNVFFVICSTCLLCTRRITQENSLALIVACDSKQFTLVHCSRFYALICARALLTHANLGTKSRVWTTLFPADWCQEVYGWWWWQRQQQHPHMMLLLMWMLSLLLLLYVLWSGVSKVIWGWVLHVVCMQCMGNIGLTLLSSLGRYRSKDMWERKHKNAYIVRSGNLYSGESFGSSAVGAEMVIMLLYI